MADRTLTPDEVYDKLLRAIEAGEVASFKLYLTTTGQYVRGEERYWVNTLSLEVIYSSGETEEYEWDEEAPSYAEGGNLPAWFDALEELGLTSVPDPDSEAYAEYYSADYTTKKVVGWKFNLQPQEEVRQ